MLTQCPNCQTTFRVTTEILRVADGQVRCGRCQTQFDALDRLIDENEPAQHAARSPRTTHTPAAERIEVDEPAAQEDITLEGRHIEISGRYRMPDSPRGEPQMREETVEEWVEIDDIDDEVTNEAGEIEVDEDLIEDDGPLEIEVAEEPAYEAEPEAQAEQVEPEEDLLAAPPRPAIAPVWKILAGPLVLLLAIQLVHTYRHALARHPRIGPAIVSVYRAVGVNLQPDWDLHAYEILQ
jgi:predicted Zn finger-like uncharacterized protein